MAVKLGNGKWAIKEDKLLAYNDNSGRFFNKEFDFSRGSSATFVDKDGLIKTAGLQATNLVNNGNFSELGAELITNGDFSNWTNDNPDNYNVLNENANNYVTESNGQLRMVSDNSATIAIRPEPNTMLTVGKIYKVSVDLTFTTGTLDISGVQFNTSGTKVFYLTAPATYLQIAKASVLDVLIDNVSVKQVDPNDYWTLSSGASFTSLGAKITHSPTAGSIAQPSILVVGKNYRITYEITENISGGLKMNSAVDATMITTVGTHTKFFEADLTTLSISRTNATNNNVTITNISVQEIQTDTPRIDFSDSVKGALLLEPQSTNLITYSEDFSQWNLNSQITIVNNSTQSPDGVLNVQKIIPNTTNTKHCVARSIQSITGHTYSVFAKADGYDFILLTSHSTSAPAARGTFFDIKNGVVGTIGTATQNATIKDFGNGWYRCSIDQGSSPSSIFTVMVAEQDDVETFAGDGTSGVYVWGAQREALPYATSYIPTFGSTATRIADVCNNSGSAQDFNSEEGVLYAEISALTDGGSLRSISLNNGTSNVIVIIRYRSDTNQIQYLIKDGVNADVGGTHTLSDATQYSKVAVRYENNNTSFFVNGSKVLSATPNLSLSGLNNLSFNSGGSADFYGKVRELQVFTELLTDAQLQKLTTI